MRLIITILLSAISSYGMPIFTGGTFNDYMAWRAVMQSEGRMTEAEQHRLDVAENQITHFIGTLLEFGEYHKINAAYVKIVRNKSIDEIELLASLIDLKKKMEIKEGLESTSRESNALAEQAHTKEEQEGIKRLRDFFLYSIRKADESVAESRQCLIKKLEDPDKGGKSDVPACKPATS